MPEATDFEGIIRALHDSGLRFVIVGGLAMRMHGSANLTQDVDVLYPHDQEGIRLLVLALQPFHPKLRGAPDDLPFKWDAIAFGHTFNFTLSTSLGAVDVLAHVPGVPDFDGVWQRSVEMDAYGMKVRVASIDDLIEMKKASGRPRDLGHLAELEALKLLN